MKTVFTTAGLHARDRFEYWHDIAERVLVGHDSSPIRRERFVAELRAAELADVGLYSFDNGAMRCARERRHIVNSDAGELFLCRQSTGRFALEQCGRRNVYGPGDMVLLDSSLPYSVRFTDGSNMLMVKVPRKLLEARFGSLRKFFGAKLEMSAGLNAYLSETLPILSRNAGDFGDAATEALRNQLVDLLTFALGALDDDDPDRRLSTPRSLAVMRLRAAIENRLADPGLDSETAAGAAGMSVRYANSLLEAEGTSVAKLIRETRLAKCRAALSDPAQDNRTISEIAFGWGFNDLTHFGKVFGAAFGLTPRAFRQARAVSDDGVEALVADLAEFPGL